MAKFNFCLRNLFKFPVIRKLKVEHFTDRIDAWFFLRVVISMTCHSLTQFHFCNRTRCWRLYRKAKRTPSWNRPGYDVLFGIENWHECKGEPFWTHGRVFWRIINRNRIPKVQHLPTIIEEKKRGFRSHTISISFHTFQLTRQVEELEPMTPSRPGKEMILQSRSIAGVKLDIPCERNVSWIYDEIDGHVVHMICLIVLHDPQFGSSNVISRGESKWHLKYENHVLNSVYRYDMDFK